MAACTDPTGHDGPLHIPGGRARALLGCLLGCLLAGVAVPAAAGDWPQILGPGRDGRALGEPDLQAWKTAPAPQWQKEVGEGFAGPAVAENRVVLFHRVNDVERVEAWDAGSGRPLWKTDFPARYAGGVNPDTGPRCVPVIHQQRVYLFGAAGDLYCVSLRDGGRQWSRAAYQDFRGQEGYFGAGSTPLVADGKLIVNVGGRDAGLVAFDLETGKTAWQATREAASYSSPTLTRVGDQPMAIFVTRLNCVGVRPADGRVEFTFPFGARGPTVNAATPLVFDGRLFVSAAYGVGGKLLRLTAEEPTTVWSNDTSMSSQYTTCVHHDGFLYGTHGREDYRNGTLRCVDAATGAVRWDAPQVGVAHVILVNDQLLILSNSGRLLLAPASPRGFEVRAQARLTSHTVRALPALSDQRLFFRDQSGRGGTLYAVPLP